RQSATPDWLLTLPRARLRQSTMFACCAELGAASSIALSTLLLSLVSFPSLTSEAMKSGRDWLIGAAVTGTFGVLMVLLHVVWGLCLELALCLTTHRRELRKSVTFALYACGGDVLTS